MAKKVKGFEDFQREGEKEKLQKIKRSFNPNSDQQQHVTNTRNEFDEKTRKITAVTKDEVEDKIGSIEGIEENIDCENSGQLGRIQFYNQWRLPNEMSFGVAEK